MKLYSIYTEEVNELKKVFLDTIQDNWELKLFNFGKTGQNGNFGTPEYVKLIRKRLNMLWKL